MSPATTTPSTPAPTQSIKSAAAAVVGANVIIQTYINTILNTPDIDLSSVTFSTANQHVVADLPAHQKTARAHAGTYSSGDNSLNAQMVNTLSTIIGYANMFDSFYPTLVKLAGSLDTPGNRTTFNQGLQTIITIVQTNEGGCAGIVTALNAFQTLIEGDERSLQGDEDIIKATLDGEDGAITKLQKSIGSINDAIQKDNDMIAGGPAMEAGGLLMVVVGALAEIETAGLSTALVVGGLAVAAGGIAMQAVASQDLGEKINQLQSDQTELSTDQQIASCLINASQNVSAMVASIKNAAAAVETLQTGWSGLKGDLQQIIVPLDMGKITDGPFLLNELNAAKLDCDDALALAIKLQANGTLQVQNSNPINYPKPA